MRRAVRILLVTLLTVLTWSSLAAAQPPPPPRIAVPAAGSADPVRGTGFILGRVVDAASGGPVAAAIVWISGGGLGPEAPRVIADNEGRFLFRDLPKGSYSISAAKSGYISGAFGRRRPSGLGQQLELEDGERAADAIVPMWKFAAIEGLVVDEAGEPLPGVMVRAYLRSLVGARRTWRAVGSTSGTDDRGIYRIWNLLPGDYVVVIESTTVAVPAAFLDEYQAASGGSDPARTALIRELMAASGGGFSPIGVRIGDLVQTVARAPMPPPAAPGAPIVTYPTTFYPAASTAAAATVVTLRSGEERVGVDMQLRFAPAVRVSGTVMGPDGPVANVAVRLTAAGAEDVLAPFEMNAATGVSNAAGAFTLLAVPPGQYMLRVAKVPVSGGRSNLTTTTIVQSGSFTIMSGTPTETPSSPPPLPTGPALWASVPIAVGTSDLTGVLVSLQPGGRVTGRVEFDGSAEKPTPAQLQRIAVFAERSGSPAPSMLGPATMGRVDANGQFATPGLVGGRYVIVVPGAPPGWTFKSAIYEGRDLADAPFETGASDLKGVVITFTDRPSELSGRVTGEDGNPDRDATVLIFPVDPAAWGEHALNSRRVRGVRTTSAGRYSARGLPPGEYYAIAVPDELASEWQDPKSLELLAQSASSLRVEDGQKAMQDLRTRRVAR